MKQTDIPVACTLTEEELPSRRERLLKMREAVQEVHEQDDGFAYRFASDDVLCDPTEIITAERQCCPFLRFRLTIEPGHGPLWLEVTGPAGAKEVVASFFGKSTTCE